MKSNQNLLISVSGVRGTIPERLNLQAILNFTQAFVDLLRPKTIVLGRDSRPSGAYIEKLVEGLLLSKGVNVVSVGIVPTPTLKAVVVTTNASGGIMISASHNPIQWNAFKFVGKKGLFFNQTQMENLQKLCQKEKFTPIKPIPKSTSKFEPSLVDLHIESVLKRVQVERIRKRKFKVLLDAVNGGGSLVAPLLLEKLGCKVTKVFCEPTGLFPREPEPTPQALQKTYRLMKQTDCEIGFALDPDADRLVLLTPERGAISEEYTLPLSLFSVLQTAKGTNVVINLSSSFITQTILEPFGKNLIRSKVGEANVVSDMLKSKAFFGGEGNGGVIDPEVPSFGRDSLSGMAHILNMLALEETTIERKLDTLPKIFMEKRAYSLKDRDLKTIYQKVRSRFSHASLDIRDGLRVDLGERWFHMRPSNTEPIFRVIAEAKTEGDLKLTFAQLEPLIQ